MRIGLTLALIFGLAIAVALIGYYGAASIAEQIARMGWGLLAVLAVQVVPLVCTAEAWRVLADTKVTVSLALGLRLVREAVNQLLPVARMGGDLAGVRYAVLHRVRPPLAAASILADKTLELASQVPFALAGVAVLVWIDAGDDIVAAAMVGTVVLAALGGIFYAAQHWGLLRLAERLIERLFTGGDNGAPNAFAGMHDQLLALYAHRRRVAVAVLLHLVAWVLGSAQIWLALHFMGHPVGLAEAFVMEALVQAISSAAFMFPAALGAQEAGYMLLGGVFGLAPEVGLALSLVRRVSTVVYGIPGLVLWQVSEGKRAWLTWAARRAGVAD